MNYDRYVDDVRIEDISYTYKDMVDIMGIENFIELTEVYGGSCIYIPMKKNVLIPCRNRLIKAKFDGINYREVAKEFDVSVNQVKVIVR